jgi:hypothetical protein
MGWIILAGHVAKSYYVRYDLGEFDAEPLMGTESVDQWVEQNIRKGFYDDFYDEEIEWMEDGFCEYLEWVLDLPEVKIVL